MLGHRNFCFRTSAIGIALVRCVVLRVLARSGLARAADCMIDPFVALRSAMLRDVQPLPPTLPQLGRARCGIVRHRRCPNPRVPRSTPSAYSRRDNDTMKARQGWHRSKDAKRFEPRHLPPGGVRRNVVTVEHARGDSETFRSFPLAVARLRAQHCSTGHGRHRLSRCPRQPSCQRSRPGIVRAAHVGNHLHIAARYPELG